jgi:membrane protease subunit (stomatin/prohibitin family)
MFKGFSQPATNEAPASNAKCASCGASLPANAKFCLECGEKVVSNDSVVCPECGNTVAKGKFCPECGHKFITACPKCGAGITAGAKFCLECGEKL